MKKLLVGNRAKRGKRQLYQAKAKTDEITDNTESQLFHRNVRRWRSPLDLEDESKPCKISPFLINYAGSSPHLNAAAKTITIDSGCLAQANIGLLGASRSFIFFPYSRHFGMRGRLDVRSLRYNDAPSPHSIAYTLELKSAIYQISLRRRLWCAGIQDAESEGLRDGVGFTVMLLIELM